MNKRAYNKFRVANVKPPLILHGTRMRCRECRSTYSIGLSRNGYGDEFNYPELMDRSSSWGACSCNSMYSIATMMVPVE